MTPKQIARKLERSIQNWDFQKAIDFSNNETKTRDYLIEPFFKILGFNEMDDYAHEFTIKFPDGNLKYLDMAIFSLLPLALLGFLSTSSPCPCCCSSS